MKPYGVDRQDRGCCPGHDKFPVETYRSSRSKHARSKSDRIAHKRARARDRQEIARARDRQEIEETHE